MRNGVLKTVKWFENCNFLCCQLSANVCLPMYVCMTQTCSSRKNVDYQHSHMQHSGNARRREQNGSLIIRATKSNLKADAC